MDNVEVAGIAVLVLHDPLGFPLVRLIGGNGSLGRFLGSLPSLPRLSLDAINLAEFQFPRLVEVAHGRFPPLGLDLLQVLADGRLFDIHLLGDLALSPTLQVEIGNLFPAFGNRQFFTVSG